MTRTRPNRPGTEVGRRSIVGAAGLFPQLAVAGRILSFMALAIASAHAAYGAGQPDPSLEVYGRPQALVDIGGRRLNLYCLGHGSPTVILVGGLGASSFAWRKVHAELARRTRVCAYDLQAMGIAIQGNCRAIRAISPRKNRDGDARRGGAPLVAGGNRSVPGASHQLMLSAPQAVISSPAKTRSP